MFAASPASATPATAPLSRAQFASGVNLVEVYATVTDARGQLVGALTADDFAITEDGVAQPIAAFAAGEFPVAVALGIDCSFSVPPAALARVKRAARAFVAALRAGDQVMVIAIGGDVTVASPLSNDHQKALAAIDGVERWGSTPLRDAAVAAIGAIQHAGGRRALVLMSDGADRSSQSTLDQVVDEARRHDVLVYPIGTGRRQPPIFAALARVTGGRSFAAPGGRALTRALGDIARELRFQYLIGYAPPHGAGAPPRWRAIHVAVRRPGVRVRARDGYLR